MGSMDVEAFRAHPTQPQGRDSERLHGYSREQRERRALVTNVLDALASRIDQPLEADGRTRHVPVQNETLIVLGEILHELRRLNSPWLAPKEIGTYVGANPSIVTQWKKAGLLKPHVFPGMANPRYRREDVDALADLPPGVSKKSKKRETPPAR
jgi:hypothetical protein